MNLVKWSSILEDVFKQVFGKNLVNRRSVFVALIPVATHDRRLVTN